MSERKETPECICFEENGSEFDLVRVDGMMLGSTTYG
jgi:hypothetical protein